MINIILATYNGEKYINEQIKSLFDSRYKNFRIFVFDDGSEDNTIALLKEWEKKYPDRLFINRNEENQGAGKNFLNALYMLQYEKDRLNLPDDFSEDAYYMFCDQDDVWKKDKIRRSFARIQAMEERYGKDIPLLAFSDACVVDKELSVINESFFELTKMNPKSHKLSGLLCENKCIGCTIIFNYALLKKISFVPQNARVHDWWVALIAEAFGHISYIDKPLLEYRQHGGNVIGGESFASYVKERAGELKKLEERVNSLYVQAEEFLSAYRDELPQKALETLLVFTSLKAMNPVTRRKTALEYGFLKSGAVRNLGLMLFI